ncbi:hypothetical protein psal_cds_263 [Pandoravirus salinus]|uniref:Uncharacterized protein n=1 Tax=Pandoravirus salinus TaxID=1349410 RepID=S4W0D3_9VIRU|nr:hypothetical protein psal_cds_263 [Pandoravirus salinus]AGO83832.1 hypothetical protein psal_cds_263 [Pandoravirus salinus]
MQGNEDDGFDWAALVPQASTVTASSNNNNAAQAHVMRLDDDTARALASAGAGAIDAGYAGPLGVWSARVYQATRSDFEQRPEVRQECSTGCLDLQGEFTQQKARENVLIEQERHKARERKRAYDEIVLANMDENARIMALISRGLNDLERCLNLHGGYMAKVQGSLGRAADLVHAADVAGRGSRIGPSARAALTDAIAEERLHNWTYLQDVASLARDALLREMAYREALDAAGVVQPFGAPLTATPMPPAVRDCLVASTNMGERGATRHDYAPF